VKTAYTAIYQH